MSRGRHVSVTAQMQEFATERNRKGAHFFRIWCQASGVRVEALEDEYGRARGLLVLLMDEALADGSCGDPVVECYLSRAKEFGISSGHSLARFWFSFDSYQSPTDPWVTAINLAITRANIDRIPRLAATCHLLDPAWREFIEKLVVGMPGGICDVVAGAAVPTARSLRVPPAHGDKDFLWRFLFMVAPEQVDEPKLGVQTKSEATLMALRQGYLG